MTIWIAFLAGLLAGSPVWWLLCTRHYQHFIRLLNEDLRQSNQDYRDLLAEALRIARIADQQRLEGDEWKDA